MGSYAGVSHLLEYRDVLAYRDGDLDGMSRAFACVVLAETFPQAVRLNPNDRIGILVEGVPPVKDIEADRIFLDLGALPSECLFAQVRKQMS